MTPGLSSLDHDEPLQGLFRRLLGSEGRPLVILVVESILGVPQVSRPLVQPVAPSVHVVATSVRLIACC